MPKYNYEFIDKKFRKAYDNMKQRMENPNNPKYPKYGGYGLKHDFDSFDDFIERLYASFLEHFKKHGAADTTIERIDNDYGYVKGNVKWATREEQYNNKQDTIHFRYITPAGQHGVARNVSKFAERYNLVEGRIYYHLYYGSGYHKGWYFDLISKQEYMLIQQNIEKIYEIPEDTLKGIAVKISISIDDKELDAIIKEVIQEWVKRKLDEL